MSGHEPARPARGLFAFVGPPEPRWKSVLRWAVGLIGVFALVWYGSGLYGVTILALILLVEGYRFRRLMAERDKVLDEGREWQETPITLSIDRVRPDRESK